MTRAEIVPRRLALHRLPWPRALGGAGETVPRSQWCLGRRVTHRPGRTLTDSLWDRRSTDSRELKPACARACPRRALAKASAQGHGTRPGRRERGPWTTATVRSGIHGGHPRRHAARGSGARPRSRGDPRRSSPRRHSAARAEVAWLAGARRGDAWRYACVCRRRVIPRSHSVTAPFLDRSLSAFALALSCPLQADTLVALEHQRAEFGRVAYGSDVHSFLTVIWLAAAPSSSAAMTPRNASSAAPGRPFPLLDTREANIVSRSRTWSSSAAAGAPASTSPARTTNGSLGDTTHHRRSTSHSVE